MEDPLDRGAVSVLGQAAGCNGQIRRLTVREGGECRKEGELSGGWRWRGGVFCRPTARNQPLFPRG
jgi:hypothetical protein